MNVPFFFIYPIVYLSYFVGIGQTLTLTDPHEFSNMLAAPKLMLLAAQQHLAIEPLTALASYLYKLSDL